MNHINWWPWITLFGGWALAGLLAYLFIRGATKKPDPEH